MSPMALLKRVGERHGDPTTAVASNNGLDSNRVPHVIVCNFENCFQNYYLGRILLLNNVEITTSFKIHFGTMQKLFLPKLFV